MNQSNVNQSFQAQKFLEVISGYESKKSKREGFNRASDVAYNAHKSATTNDNPEVSHLPSPDDENLSTSQIKPPAWLSKISPENLDAIKSEKDLIASIAKATNVTPACAEVIIQTYANWLMNRLVKGKVKTSYFGTWRAKIIRAKEMTSNLTKETFTVPEKLKVKIEADSIFDTVKLWIKDEKA